VSYRRRAAGGAGLEVGEDGRDHPRVGDDGEHSQCCTAARATGDVDVEHPAQTLRPCHLCASGCRLLVGTLARGRRRGHDEAAMARVRGKHAVETHEMGSRSWYQRGQAGDEVQWLEQNMGGAVTERVLEFVDHQPVPVAAQTLTRNGGARHIPAQPLQLLHPLARKVAGHRAPRTRLEGKFPVSYCVSLGLDGRRATEADFSPARLEDVGLRRVEQVVTVSAVHDLEPCAARLRVHLAAGGTASSSVAVSLGNPDNPMSWGDLRDKFTPLVEPVLADGSAARFDALRGFDLAGTLARVVALAA